MSEGRGRGRGRGGDGSERGGRGGRGRGRRGGGGLDTASSAGDARSTAGPSDWGGRGGSRGGGERGGHGGGRGDGGRGGRGGGRGDSESYRGGGGRGAGRGAGRGNDDSSRGGGRGGGQGYGEYRGGGRGGDRGGGRGRGGDFSISMRGGRGGYQGRGGRSREPPRPFSYQGEQPPQPDQNVATLENQLMAPARGSKPKPAKRGQAQQRLDPSKFRFPHRPAYGAEGNPIRVWANYFEMVITDMAPLFLYTFHVRRAQKPAEEGSEGGVSSRGDRGDRGDADIKGPFLRRVLRHAVDTILNVPGLSPRTELQSKLITSQRIPQDKIDELKDVQFDGGHFVIELDGPHTLDPGPLRDWLTTMRDQRDIDDASFPKFQDLVDAIGIIIGHGPRMGGSNLQGNHLRTVAVGGNRFYPIDESRETEFLQRSRPLEILRGYFQSVRPATGRLLLNVNITHSVFRSSRERPFADLFNDCHYKDLELALKGARVRVTYPDQSEKEYGVSGFLFKPGASNMGEQRFKKISEVTFNLHSSGKGGDKGGGKKNKAAAAAVAAGPKTTVLAYLKEKFNTPSLSDSIAVNVGKSASNPVIYPASWCTLIPGQPWNRKLSGEDTTAMINFACRQPNKNADSIVTVGRQVLQIDSANASFRDYNITIGDKLITVNARVLAAPELCYGKRFKMTPIDGSWNLAKRELVQGGAKSAPLVDWAYFVMPGSRGSVEAAVGEFGATVKELSVPISNRAVALGASDDSRRFDRYSVDGIYGAVDAAFERALQLPNRPKIILFVLADNDKTAYERIKLQGDCTYGIHTVCVISAKFAKNDKQYFANVALKFNLKLGGINHKLDKPDKLGIISEGKTMVVGYDIIHPTNLGGGKDVEALPSHVGLVASINKDLAQWPACQWSQTGRQELASNELVGAFQSRLDRWREHNHAYPENILVYRDGVSEGQFEQVLDVELPQMKEALQRCNMARAKITIVVSVKRHNTRFFPTREEEMNRSGNVKCGTIVDRGITLQRYWDFFLTAHTAIQGTARPARYTVIYDEIFQSRGSEPAAMTSELEKITYNMCYLFSRATKSVSICPPAYYADIVCTRARLYQSTLFNQAMEGLTVNPNDRVLPQVHENVRRDMYYI